MKYIDRFMNSPAFPILVVVAFLVVAYIDEMTQLPLTWFNGGVEMKEAEIEFISVAVAYCPECQDQHDVSTCDSGEINCICGETFHWSTEQ